MLELLLFVASALLGSGVLFAHRRMLTYLACAGVLFQAEFLLSTFIRRTFIPSVNGSTFYLIAGIIFTTLWVALYKNWKSPYVIAGSGKRDAYVGLTLLIVLALAFPIIRSNGFVGEEFVMRGFYNGDTATFASLIQKSFYTSALLHENPFAGNGPLEYPTLLHGAFADFFSLLDTGTDWLRYLGLMTYAQIFITIPMFFLLWDTVFPEQKKKYFYAMQVVLTLVAILLSLDSYVYPQSHFFLSALFLGVVALFTKASGLAGKAQLLPVISAYIGTILLLFANTVTGTAAVACGGAFALIRIFDKKRGIPERIVYITVAILLVFLMRQASTGRVAFNNPRFSISAAADMMRAGLPVLFVLAASIYYLGRKQYIAIASILTASLGFITFFLADRNIVAENASRFLYHGFLIGFPLLLMPIMQYMYFIRRELHLTARPTSEIVAGHVAAVCMGLILLLPLGVSAGSTYVNLLKNDKHVISFNTRTTMYWIESKTSPKDIIIASPNEPYVIPIFTGRSLLRLHDYWLSPQDETTNDLVQAFAGNKDSQKKILAQGQYLFLDHNEISSWDVSKLKKVFESPEATVYQVR